jgi:hypothetical protein
MKIIVDKEAQDVLSYLVDITLRSEGLKAHNNLYKFMHAIEPLKEKTENKKTDKTIKD